MADDGMLLNLAAPSGDLWQPKAVFKGRWKDRLTARKSAEYGAQKRKERAEERGTGANAIPSSIVRNGGERTSAVAAVVQEVEEQASKRRKVDFLPKTTSTHERSMQSPALAQHRGKGQRDSKAGPREVISSLFTYNPAATTTTTIAEEGADQDAAPSNAPLSPEEETFTKLGLDRAVAQHLLTKMEIKAPTSIQRKAVQQLLKDDTDAFLQAETGSGKTLAYLLPIVQRLLNLSAALKEKNGDRITRDSGLFAIIVAPTRELCRQISTVLEVLLGCAHWVVSGSVSGGEKKKSEKARLRKGLNILVATPGRLVDHLSNTKVLDLCRVRWLVLDEGDRLMELGFEQDIQKLVSALNLRLKSTSATSGDLGALLPTTRTTVLCSATLKMDVQRLGEISLKDAAHVAGDRRDAKVGDTEDGQDSNQAFEAPSQLKQSYAVVPAKQRLVTLVAVLRRAFMRKGAVQKTIVFLSCADSVDFHFYLLTKQATDTPATAAPAVSHGAATSTTSATPAGKGSTIAQGAILPDTLTSQPSAAITTGADNAITAFRLHGSLPQHTRTTTLQDFAKHPTAAVLLCTDVASRGLDLPNIDLVLEYDPPFSRDEHLHRIGRTARAGRAGRASIFLLPGCEEGYIPLLSSGGGTKATGQDAEELLRRGFGPLTGVVQAGDRRWEEAATEWQLGVERWVLEDARLLEMARRAYQSHVRAYATHVAAERGCFDIKQLHLGHLAKAFGLRDRPGAINVPGLRQGKEAVKRARDRAGGGKGAAGQSDGKEVEVLSDAAEARRKMLKMSRSMGGASEFNIG